MYVGINHCNLLTAGADDLENLPLSFPGLWTLDSGLWTLDWSMNNVVTFARNTGALTIGK